MTLQEYRTLIGYQIRERPVRTQVDEVCQWLSDNGAQFQWMISIMYSYKTTSVHYRAVVRDLMSAVQDNCPAGEHSYFVAFETHPVNHIHLFVNSDRFILKSHIEEYCTKRGMDVAIKPYYSINGISYALKSMAWDKDFEYDFSPNLFTVKL